MIVETEIGNVPEERVCPSHKRSPWYRRLWNELGMSFWPTDMQKAMGISTSYFERRKRRKELAKAWKKFMGEHSRPYVMPLFKIDDIKPWPKEGIRLESSFNTIDMYNKVTQAVEEEEDSG